ncbi:MAG: radical SAM protein [Egibacteraceae bacterium]
MRDVTLLWALRSPCNLGCAYCYFGTIEDHRLGPPTQPGQLSHISRGDLSFADIEAFLRTIGDSDIARVFLAGGEPLIWPQTLTVVEILKAADVAVVICTNGIPLNRPEISERIISLSVDGVSVSLDSIDAEDNDRYRPSRNGVHGWADVVSGIRRLIDARADRPVPRVGLYTVITRRNIPAVREVAAFGSELGLDYYVPQPVSLAPDHALHDELSLREQDIPALIAALDDLYQADLSICLPERPYAGQFVATITTPMPGFVASCFGGHTLFFIEPDGSVWDCPSG